MSVDEAARHADDITRLQLLTSRAGRRAWSRVDERWISESWAEALREFEAVITAAQVRAATYGAEYGAAALAEQGLYTPPNAFVRPAGFADISPDGRPLRGLLYSPATTAKSLIAEGASTSGALAAAGGRLDRILKSILSDTSRQAAGVDLAARPRVGYVRQLVGKSCPDCLILAGRYYRWNEGFDRHPGDDCVHVPTTEAAASGVTVDPYAHFNAMSAAEQDEFWGAANAKAIRDGADIYQVHNAKRGMTKTGIFTTEGTTRRGRASLGLARGQRRLTPEGIYQMYPDRADALRALEQHGYVLPGGQLPGGSIRGANYEGFGALGKGGTARAATDAVLRARETGVRDPSVRYTMTAAERRLHDATLDWETVLAGRNPWGAPGFGTTADPTGRIRRATSTAPLTPAVAAAVEKNYRRWAATGGQIFGR